MISRTEPLRVLIVDDERVIADSLAMILRCKGHNALAVYDCDAAIALAEDFDPDAVISDVVMPGMNGIELSTYFEFHFPGCRVLLTSGNAATTGLLEDARRHGHVLNFLSKPVNPDEVLQFLASCRLERGLSLHPSPASRLSAADDLS